MADEQMDARLHRAGEAWRAANEATAAMPTAVAGDVHVITPEPSRRSRHTGLLASAAVVAAALVAGGIVLFNGVGHHPTTSTDQAVALKGTVWRLVGYGNDQPRTNSLATLHIGKDDRMVADDGCTLIGARISTDHGRIAFTDFDERYRECTDSSGDITFTRAMDILTSFPHYSIDGTQLTIGAMHFLAAPELPAPTLDVPTFLGAKWRLVKVTDAQGQDRPLSGFSPALQVKNGRLTTSDGCNTLTADAVADGQEVDLKQVEHTTNPCPSAAESAFGAAIDQVFAGPAVHEQVEGTTLILKRSGAGELVYQWVPDDKAAADPANLIGRNWQLVSAAGDPSAGGATLRIDGDELSGDDSCGELSGRADVGRGTLTVAGVPQQPAASCTGQATTIDSFLNQKPALWSIRDGKLLIYGGGPQAFSLVFTTAVPPAPSPTPTPGSQLVGTWSLSGIEHDTAGGGSASGSSDMATTKLIVDSAGHAIVRHRCYALNGDVRIAGRFLEFSNLVRNPHGPPCTAARQQQDTYAGPVDAVLSGAVRWSIDGGQLTLTKGHETLTFDR